MVETHKCGLFVDPKDPGDLANKIIYLKENPEIVTSMGEQSRKLAETTYDKSILCHQFASLVDQLSIHKPIGTDHSLSAEQNLSSEKA